MVKYDILVHIRRRIRELRKEQHVSQEKLAGKAKIDRSFLGAIERGERNVSVLTLEKISAALNTKLSRILN